MGEDRVRGVKLPDEELAASSVLLSAGIRPNLALARTAGLQVEKGIVINGKAETSATDIYAAGDCTEFNERIYGLWPASEEQGRVAGTVMAGGEASYTGTTVGQTLKVSGVSLFSAGEINTDDDRLATRSVGDETYKKVVRNDKGKIVGAILIGDVSERQKLQAEISSAT